MYSNLTLYYLNQLGIRPWIKKDSPIALSMQQYIAKQEVIKLIVFVSANLSAKAQLLLNRMLVCINLQDHELISINVPEIDPVASLQKQWQSRLQNVAPLAILVLGLNAADLLAHLKVTCPVLRSMDPDYLLDNPVDKKKVLQDLNYINELLK